ncbi:MAG: ABC transporter permease [Fastidiosipila sp.]|jgi:ABC-2 type transport system permease protein|nr:ABC transporter permease [Fastidiosipila sp.]
MTLKNKSSLFWVFVYPLLLVTMMSIAFRGAGMKLQPIPVAAEQGFYYTVFLENIDMLDLTVMDSHEAEKALREGKVAGYFRADGVLIIREDSSESRILGEIGDELKRAAAAGRQGINPDFSTQYVSIAEQEADLLFDILSMTVAMFTLYAYFSGIGMIDLLQANLSPLAARLSTTPLSRLSFLTAGTLINTCLSFLEMILVALYLKFIWGINFLSDLPRTLLLFLAACFFGVAVGLFVGSSNKLSTKAKIPLGISIMLVLGAFGGMMGAELRLYLDRHLPWLNRGNPVNLIGRLLYRLNALSSTREYTAGILILVFGALVLSLSSLLFLQRRQFKSL